MITDWTLINKYEERHITQLHAVEAMERDVEYGIIGMDTAAERSVREYLVKFQDRLDKVCCNFIFGKNK